jgi:hypothetical protein
MEDMEHGRGEIFSKSIRAGKRTYFLDVKEMKSGDRYLAITESKRRFLEDQGKFIYEKHKIFLYQEDFEKFMKGLNQTIHFINTGERPPVEEDEQNFSQDNENKYIAKIDDIDFGV